MSYNNNHLFNYISQYQYSQPSQLQTQLKHENLSNIKYQKFFNNFFLYEKF